MTRTILQSGEASRIFNQVSKINVGGSFWINKDEAKNFIKIETLQITKNGVYYAPKGTLYNRVVVKIKRKDRAKAGSAAPSATKQEKIYSAKDITIKQLRETVSFQAVRQIETKGADGATITWIAEEDASYYVAAEQFTVEDNGTYNAENDKLYDIVIAHVEKDEDDNDNPGGGSGGGGGSGSTELNLITKDIVQNGVYTAADEGANGYASVNVNVPAMCNENIGAYWILENGYYDVNINSTRQLGSVGSTLLVPSDGYRNRANWWLTSDGYSYYKGENGEMFALQKVTGWEYAVIQVFKTYRVEYLAPLSAVIACANNYLSANNYSVTNLNNVLNTFDTSGCNCFDCNISGATDVTTLRNAFGSREDYCYEIIITIRGFKALEKVPFGTTVEGVLDRSSEICNHYTHKRRGYADEPYGAYDGFEGVRQMSFSFRTQDRAELGRAPTTSDIFTSYKETKLDLAQNVRPYIGILATEAFYGVYSSDLRRLRFGGINMRAA